MPSIFAKRDFVESFQTRNVVFESSATIARNNDLIVRTVLEFGSNNGHIRKQVVINASAFNGFGLATQLGIYQAEILDVIDAFECFSDWLRGPKTETFSMFLDHKAPLYFYGKVVEGEVIFSIFGPNLINLQLKNENGKKIDTSPFRERINAMAQCYRDHLKELDELPMDQMIKQVLINAVNNKEVKVA